MKRRLSGSETHVSSDVPYSTKFSRNSSYNEWDSRLQIEAQRIGLEILNGDSMSSSKESDLESISIIGSSGASPSASATYLRKTFDSNTKA